MASSIPFRARWLAAMLVGSMLVAGCVDDRREAVVAPGYTCAAAAHVVESLQESGGAPDSGSRMRETIDGLAADLAAEGDEVGAGPSVEELRSLLPSVEGSVPREDEEAWYAALSDLDERIAGLCGFSMRVLVAGAEREAAVADPGPLEDGSSAGENEDDGSLNWASIRRRLPDASWIDAGYTGIVGVGPGVYVTVAGVPTHADAMTVCTDVLGALEPESEERDVEVRVQGLGADVYALSHGGECLGVSSMTGIRAGN